MGVQRLRHRRTEWRLPEDLPVRLAQFQEASGLSTRALAGLLGVSPYRLRRWKNGGDEPNPAHLFAVLTIAEEMELRHGILMCPERDLPDRIDVEALRRWSA
ncbi:MAG: helix-turn-helix transcriptional regulator [Chloroflexi bacterium]|nr:helix-turn-helix transcriptional regulator [Chloroflexota bacterium]MYB83652.1 helix-turn-helix transcriptional regulator [Chloroflexota bacterium]